MARSSYREEFNAEIIRFRTDFENLKVECASSANELVRDYESAFTDLQEKISNLVGISNDGNAVLNKIKSIHDNADETKNSIMEIWREILEDPDKNTYCIYNDIKDSQDFITSVYNDVTKIRDEIFGYVDKEKLTISEDKYNSLPDDERESKDNKFFQIITKDKPGIKSRFENLFKKYQTSLNEELSKIDARDANAEHKNAELYKKIEEMLPGATATGLTIAYETAKTEAKGQIKLWSIFFGIALIGIVLQSSLLIFFGAISFENNPTFEKSIIQIFRLIGFEFPFIWLAWAANIKISQYSRLYEEYRHKWTITRAFEGMQRALEEGMSSDINDDTISFYKTIIDSFALNPSKTFDKRYEPDGPFSITQRCINRIFNKNEASKEE